METVNLLTSLSKSTMSCLYSRLISMGVMISWGRCCSMRCKWSPWFSQPERGRLIVFRWGVCLWVKQSSCCAPWDRSSRESQRLREVLTEERDRELPGGSLFHFVLINGIPPPPRPSLHSNNSSAFLCRPLLSPAGVSPCHSFPVPAHRTLDAPHTHGLTGSICVPLNLLIYCENTKAGER